MTPRLDPQIKSILDGFFKQQSDLIEMVYFKKDTEDEDGQSDCQICRRPK